MPLLLGLMPNTIQILTNFPTFIQTPNPTNCPNNIPTTNPTNIPTIIPTTNLTKQASQPSNLSHYLTLHTSLRNHQKQKRGGIPKHTT